MVKMPVIMIPFPRSDRPSGQDVRTVSRETVPRCAILIICCYS
jgi:hypothetical protein